MHGTVIVYTEKILHNYTQFKQLKKSKTIKNMNITIIIIGLIN